eukprot:CAMPEP_0173120886 /NCGR_PEP_ID=MMETSP1102-20130122/52864_1 /TAXON_ID=49646 /ORGANISM="Geminigera sp., Strain Caron Lab Isolate" /LENGTH=131 /DNA_ID=CAMNT_0014027201 /DNA_START=332 /DNA_END=728 /DNA_ORIENTATION=+
MSRFKAMSAVSASRVHVDVASLPSTATAPPFTKGACKTWLKARLLSTAAAAHATRPSSFASAPIGGRRNSGQTLERCAAKTTANAITPWVYMARRTGELSTVTRALLSSVLGGLAPHHVLQTTPEPTDILQ